MNKKEVSNLLGAGSETIHRLEIENRIQREKLQIVEDMVFLARGSGPSNEHLTMTDREPLSQLMAKHAEVLRIEFADENSVDPGQRR